MTSSYDYDTQYSDRINGTVEGDLIRGHGADDWLSGGYGSDTIHGGDGDDIVYGGENLLDEASTDSKYDNFIDGGNNNDLLVGTILDDLAVGGNGEDLLLGYAGNDLLLGRDGNDRLYGYQGADTLLGENGNDFLQGNQDNDLLDGGSGNDYLSGSNERAYPEQSNIDSFTGGDGQDKFILGTAYETFYQVGQDNDLAMIADFNSQEDRIQLHGDAQDYSLKVATFSLQNSSISGTYIYNDAYVDSEAIAFVANQTDLNLAAEYIDFV